MLAFHVDYWDALGWPDRFADAAYSARQQALVRAANGRTTYTPQVFVQGKDRGLWRNGAVRDAIDAVAQDPARAKIELKVRNDGERIVVDVTAAVVGDRRSDAVLKVALTESGLSSRVTAGENRGARLEHDHVVRALVTGPGFDAGGHARGTMDIARPRERGRDANVVAFVELGSTGEILQSVMLELCGP